MINTNPLRQYLKAQETLRTGRHDTAYAELVAGIQGTPKNQVLRNNLKLFLNPDTSAGDIMLQFIISETRRASP